MAAATLGQTLDQLTARGTLYEALEGSKVRCYACAHRCLIPEGHRGVCKVRFNQAGELRVPWGYVGALQCDPTEKKPFFHVLPGSMALTFGMLGCDFHCPYCQNWYTSQALRDPASDAPPQTISSRAMVSAAVRRGARLVVSSYNEPLITAEWAVEIFREAKAAGFLTAFVSNGNATPEVLEFIRPWTDCYKIDLKSMSDKNYRRLGGKLESVLNTIASVHRLGFWLEVVTLVVPGFNDSKEELRAAAEYLCSVSPDIPWHVTAFHKDYKMREPDNTTTRHLLQAAEIGREAGLRFVYAGNIPGGVGSWEDTRCPACNETVVKRVGYVILANRLGPAGLCLRCGCHIPGRWG